jgi:ribosomal protein L7/L12
MADANLEKIIAISLLREATHCTLSEAKVKVHFSEAYKFRRASDEAFHDALFEQLDEAGLIEPEVHSVSAS